MPGEEESTSEQDGEKNTAGQLEEVAGLEPSEDDPVEVAESAPEEEAVAEEQVEEEDDDDGPRVPMGRAPRDKSAEKEVTETT